MNFARKSKTKCFWMRVFCLMISLVVVLWPALAKAADEAENESIQHYKMLSSVEYSGKGQFQNQVETLFTVKKEFLSDDRVQYRISSNDFNLLEEDSETIQQPSFGGLSFVIDGQTGRLSQICQEQDLGFIEKVNNHCLNSLEKVTKDNIGKTWKQSFNMPFLDHLFSGEMKFTLTAIRLYRLKLGGKSYGEMIAVRALSEPFAVKTTKENGETGKVMSRIGIVYLFDPEIEDVYLSLSAFEATTKMNGFKESLRHEIATYKTNATGKSVNLSGLGSDFEKLVRKIGLSKEGLKVVQETPLPQWAQYEGLAASQVAHVCASTACEGSLNPVATICVPIAHTIAMQSRGKLVKADSIGAISNALATRVGGIGTLKIAAAPLIMGVSPTTAGLVAGGAAGSVAIAGGGSGGGSSSRSPEVP